MTDLSKNTPPSPRFECDTLCYFEGDTFYLELPDIELESDGIPINIGPEDEISITFVDRMGKTVAERRYTGIENNSIIIEWDQELTACFQKGTYTYRIRYNGQRVLTVSADCKICVQ